MMRKLRFWQRGCVIAAVTLIAGAGLALEDAPSSVDKKSDEAAATRLEEMRKIVDGIKVMSVAEEGERLVDRVEGPRFRYDAPLLPCDDATSWIWGAEKKRPLMILTVGGVWPGSKSAGAWSYEFTTLSRQKLRIEGEDQVRWTPMEGGLEFNPLPDAPPPADTPARRLTQMKTMARRFSAYGVYPTVRRFELRVLPTPIYRYEDGEQGVVDGAIFFIAGGVDPEVMLALELSQDAQGHQTWNYALNRVSSGELHVSLDDRETWATERLSAEDPNGVYFLVIRPMSGHSQ
jgi:hypothetical protein